MAVLALALLGMWSAPLSAAPLLGIKGGGDDADKWLINEPEVVLTINIKQMNGVGHHEGQHADDEGSAQTQRGRQGALEATGVDPFKDIESILISRKRAGASQPRTPSG